MNERLHDIATIPNGLTVGRLVLSPVVAKKLKNNPARWWAPTAAFLASDNLDGILARLEDTHPHLAEYGFRRSEAGRVLDPLTDKVVGAEMLLAGMRAGSIPKTLGIAALAQKTVMSTRALYANAIGLDLQVSTLGKRSEFAQNFGFGMLCASESITDLDVRDDFRIAVGTIATAGVLGSVLTDLDYKQQLADFTFSKH